MGATKKQRGTRIISTMIDGARYEMNTLPSDVGIKAVLQCVRLFGSAYVSSVDDFDLSLLVQKLDDQEMLDWIGVMITGLGCDGIDVEFNEHFSANYGELLSVLKWSCEENFKSFFGGAPDLQKFMDLAKKKGRQAPLQRATDETPAPRTLIS